MASKLEEIVENIRTGDAICTNRQKCSTSVDRQDIEDEDAMRRMQRGSRGDLTQFSFSWTQDRGNGKNHVPSSLCPQLQSMALVAVGRQHSLETRAGDRSRQSGGAAGTSLHRCGRRKLGDTGGRVSRSFFPTHK